MEKTINFIESEFEKFDDLYCDWSYKLKEKESALAQAQHEYNYAKSTVEEYKSERNRYKEMLEELSQKENN